VVSSIDKFQQNTPGGKKVHHEKKKSRGENRTEASQRCEKETEPKDPEKLGPNKKRNVKGTRTKVPLVA